MAAARRDCPGCALGALLQQLSGRHSDKQGKHIIHFLHRSSSRPPLLHAVSSRRLSTARRFRPARSLPVLNRRSARLSHPSATVPRRWSRVVDRSASLTSHTILVSSLAHTSQPITHTPRWHTGRARTKHKVRCGPDLRAACESGTAAVAQDGTHCTRMPGGSRTDICKCACTLTRCWRRMARAARSLVVVLCGTCNVHACAGRRRFSMWARSDDVSEHVLCARTKPLYRHGHAAVLSKREPSRMHPWSRIALHTVALRARLCTRLPPHRTPVVSAYMGKPE